MHISLFENFGALNSGPVFDAFKQGLDCLGVRYSSHDTSADVAVIWSMLWSGRMKQNQQVWNLFRQSGRPVIVLEVGMLVRGRTWKVGLNGTNSLALWPSINDTNRSKKLGLLLSPWKSDGKHILITAQRTDSEQWQGQPPMDIWLQTVVDQLRTITSRPIVIRSHPRQHIKPITGCQLQKPQPVLDTYDGFNFNSALNNCWAVVNWNSGPGPQSIIAGVPAFVDASSLAADVGNKDITQIETPLRPDRTQWLEKIAHTEWTTDEIATGQPIANLLNNYIFHSSSA